MTFEDHRIQRWGLRIGRPAGLDALLVEPVDELLRERGPELFGLGLVLVRRLGTPSVAGSVGIDQGVRGRCREVVDEKNGGPRQHPVRPVALHGVDARARAGEAR